MRKSLLRRLLFRLLPFEAYLQVLSVGYFASMKLGLLRGNRLYDYPYFIRDNTLIEPGDVVIDIGANLGYMTVLFSDMVGEQGKVYAVEPVEPVLKVLERNTRRRSNVEIIPYALGSENKRIKLGNVSKQSRGYVASGSHFVLDHNVTNRSRADTEFAADMRKGSEVFGHLERLDFIKCDVEGYEVVVIPELEALIVEHRPMVLLEARRESRKKMLDFFRTRGFEAYVLDDQKLGRAQEGQYWDMLIVHQDHHDRIRAFLQ